MQHILIVASILFAILPSCKKADKAPDNAASTQGSGATSGACPANLGMMEIPAAPANVPAANMNQLGLTFSVTPSVTSNGVTNFDLTIDPTPINKWDGMPKELEGRLADFPRVSICDANSNCVAIDSNSKVVSKKNGQFDFPFWSGTVAIPSNLKGTLFFKASACTYVRDAQGAIAAAPNNIACSSYQTPASPAELDRPSPGTKSNVALLQMQLQYKILNLGTGLVAPAHGFLQSSTQADNQSAQILTKLAQTIVMNPYSVGAFLGSPAYDDFQDEVQEGLTTPEEGKLELADSTANCASALNQATTPPPVVTALNNDENGNLMGPPEVVVVTVTQTAPGSTVTVSTTSTVTDMKTVTDVRTVTDIDIGATMAMTNYKIRVLDVNGKVGGCLQESAKNQPAFGPCEDNNYNRWDLQPVSKVVGFQVVSKQNGQCLKQWATALTIAPCNPLDEAQYFKFQLSQTQTTAPILGTDPNGSPVFSSAPYAMIGFKDKKPVNCQNYSGSGFASELNKGTDATGPDCKTLFTLDSNVEYLTGTQKYATTMGAKASNATLGTIGSSMVFGGIVIGLVGVAMTASAIGYKQYANVKNPVSFTNIKASETIIQVKAGYTSWTISTSINGTKVKETYWTKKAYEAALDDLVSDADKSKFSTLKPGQTESVKLGATDSASILDKTKTRLQTFGRHSTSGQKFFKYGGMVVAFAGLMTTLAGAGQWIAAAEMNPPTPQMALAGSAGDPMEVFMNAILSANGKFIQYRESLANLPY